MDAFMFGIGGIILFILLLLVLPAILSYQGRKNSTTVPGTTPPATEATTGDKSKKDFGKTLTKLIALLAAGAFIYFYKWSESPAGKLLKPEYEKLGGSTREIISWLAAPLLIVTMVYLGWMILNSSAKGSISIGPFLISLFNKVIWGIVIFAVIAGSIYTWHKLNPSGPPAVVRINLSNTGNPNTSQDVVTIGPKSTIEISMTIPRTLGMAHSGCLTALGLTDLKEPIWFTLIASDGNRDTYKVSERSQQILFRTNVQSFEVKAQLVEHPAGKGSTICPFVR